MVGVLFRRAEDCSDAQLVSATEQALAGGCDEAGVTAVLDEIKRRTDMKREAASAWRSGYRGFRAP